MRVLIVDDEANIRRTLRTIEEAASGPGALKQVGRRTCDAALVDLRLGRESGLNLIEALRVGCPRLAVMVITAHASSETAVEAIRRGAVDYLPKPSTPGQVRAEPWSM